MNRRDMIIVAALINAGLLVVLFVSAVKSEPKIEETSVASSYERAIEKPVTISQKGDQIDQVISRYSAKVAKKEKIKAKALPLPTLTPQPKIVKAKATGQESFKTVTIAKGDVLERIARNNGVSVDGIMKLNQLSDSRLQIGQVLKLPPKSAAQEKIKLYTVKGGENPWTIAQKNGMQVEELLNLNNMDKEKAKKLRPGDKLRIR